jgi:hypothetical protein
LIRPPAILLAHGKDPVNRRLAEALIIAQEREIAEMRLARAARTLTADRPRGRLVAIATAARDRRCQPRSSTVTCPAARPTMSR